jgi:alginate O-acetyltransferase complex protein AlgJ
MTDAVSGATFEHRLGLAALALLLLVPLLTLWNLAAQSLAPKLAVMIGPRLRGVTEAPPPPTWTLRAFADGSLQKALTDAVTDAFPLRPLLIRINNQVRYKLFGYSGAAGVITGEGGQLIEKGYLDEYCTRNLAAFEPKARDWARQLKELQDFYTARGKIFIYLITPTKVAYMPENFGRALASCASSEEDRAGLLPLYDRLLAQAGVHAVDAASLTYDLKGKYEIDLFSVGGVHWNAIGIANAEDAILAEINRQAGQMVAPKLSWRYEVVDRAKGTDRDLLDLLNVLLPSAHYATARVTYQPAPTCRELPAASLKVAMIGGSFADTLGPTLINDGCLTRLEMYNYLYRGLRRGPDYNTVKDRLTTPDVLPLADADIVILEENEVALPATGHAMEFYRVILGR